MNASDYMTMLLVIIFMVFLAISGYSLVTRHTSGPTWLKALEGISLTIGFILLGYTVWQMPSQAHQRNLVHDQIVNTKRQQQQLMNRLPAKDKQQYQQLTHQLKQLQTKYDNMPLS